MSRLYLDLRCAAIIPDNGLRSESSHAEDGYLTRVVGPLGGSIVFEADGTYEEEIDSALSVSDIPSASIEMAFIARRQPDGGTLSLIEDGWPISG